MTENYYSHDLTFVDLIASVVLIVSHIISAFLFLMILAFSSKSISELCSIMSQLNQILKIDEKSYAKVTQKSICALITLFLIHTLSILASIKYSNEMTRPLTQYLVMPHLIMWISLTGVFYWPFPVAASLLVNRQFIFGLILQMEAYEELTLTLKQKGTFFSTYSIFSQFLIIFVSLYLFDFFTIPL